jgi:hypothetical protein
MDEVAFEETMTNRQSDQESLAALDVCVDALALHPRAMLPAIASATQTFEFGHSLGIVEVFWLCPLVFIGFATTG